MRGQVSAATIRRLRHGVELEDGMTAPARVEAMDRQAPGGTWLVMELTEGRNRQMRRMGEAVGHRVLRLHRSRYAGIGVRKLAAGRWRPITRAEWRRLGEIGGAGALSGRVLRAVRGATSVPEDTSEAIRERTAELLREVISRNGLGARRPRLDHLHDHRGPLRRLPRRRRARHRARHRAPPLRPRDPRRRGPRDVHPRDGPLLRPARPGHPPRLPPRGPTTPDGPPGVARSAPGRSA